MPIDPNRVIEVVDADEYIGFCLSCAAEQDGVEPDGRRIICDNCGKPRVTGAQEILVMGMV